MMKNFLLVGVALLIFQQVLGQAKIRKMPPNINHTSVNNFAPFVSLDGNTMVYVADVAEDNVLTLCYSVRDGVNWRDPAVLPKTVNSRLNFLKGFGLSPDGKTLYLSNNMGNGIGGFDIYVSQYNGVRWTDPVNMLLPVNSKSNEASPSLSPDGSTMYFMRCDKMDYSRGDNCKLMMSIKKSNGQWGEPVELPSSINTGNSQTPRMMGDGETLIFSSNKIQPNKGGMDLYFTRFHDGKWSSPAPLDFVNTPGDEQYVSATSAGRYLMMDAPGKRESELIEVLIPEDVRPKSSIKIEGLVTGPIDLSSPFVSVFDLHLQKQIASTRPDKNGAFVVYLKEGGVYDLSVDPEQDNFTFYSRRFDMGHEKFSLIEKVQATLKEVVAGDEILLSGISFKPGSSEINPSSSQEMRRLIRLLQGNSGKYFSVEVTMHGYLQDSVRSNPDLTETKTDTLKIPVRYKTDSINTAVKDSVVVKTLFHNNRSQIQARAICQYLISAGIPAGKLACSGKAIAEAIPENRKTAVVLVIH